MDDLDRKILSLLAKNARMPVKEIAEQVALTSPAVSSRIHKLETDGIISGYTVTLINARFIKPLDDECIRRHAARSRVVCTFEDHSISGGFNSAVLESLETGDVKTPVEAIAWPDQFIEHGSESILRKKYGLTAEAALQKIITHLNS